MGANWDRELSEKALSYFVMLAVFITLTWFNASNFDWELQGEGGTVTLAALAAVGSFLWNMRGRGGNSQKIRDLEERNRELRRELEGYWESGTVHLNDPGRNTHG